MSDDPLADDPSTAAVIGVVLGGLLSVPYPYFDGLVAALAAVVLCLAAVRHRHGAPADAAARRRPVAAIAAAAVGWIGFLAATGPLATGRGLLLALLTVPLGLPTWSVRGVARR